MTIESLTEVFKVGDLAVYKYGDFHMIGVVDEVKDKTMRINLIKDINGTWLPMNFWVSFLPCFIEGDLKKVESLNE